MAEALHRRLSIGAVEVNPLALTVRLRDTKLLAADGEMLFASFDTLEASVSAESLFRLAPVIAELRLAKPYVHLVRTDAHRCNVDDIDELIDDALKALGEQRAQAAKAWLPNNGQVAAERVFIVGTKTTGVPDGEPGAKANRVMFSLR
ncbi:MAG: hypothetical protein HYU78_14310 [Rhodocyclales bacterium]|nr:hypothetical protein [Rhodocyclales bacterium]